MTSIATDTTSPREAPARQIPDRPAPRPAPRPGSQLRAVATLTWTSLVYFVREPVGFVMQFLYPLFMLGIFNAVFTGELLQGISYAEYLLPAMITVGVITTCLQNLAITVAGERETGALRRLAVLPAPRWAHVTAKCLANSVLALANACLLMIVGHYAMGIDWPASSRSWGLLALTMVLMVATCTALGLAIGRSRPTQRAASSLVTPIVVMLQFVSGIFFPLSQLPAWMVNVFSVLPVRWSAELMREAFLPPSFAVAEPTGAWETGRGLAIVAVWLIGGVIAAIVVARRDTVDR
ncbi:MAG: ABC transporter permease [Actinomycetaceae bacterium]|nr:ABC transporter permease [Actinomycetaceae bacterium]